MYIEHLKDVNKIKAMIHALRSHLVRIEKGDEKKSPEEIDEMQLDLVRLKLRLEELSPEKASPC